MNIDWTVTGFVTVGLVVLGLIIWGVVAASGNALEITATVKAFSIQEAIFYGACLIAFAVFIGR